MAPDPRFRIVGARTIAHTPFLRVDRLHVEGPGGVAMRRETVRHPGAVAVVAVIGDEIVLIRQYRAPVGESILEIPAGKLDVHGEDPVAAASRELEEEAGYRPGALEPLVSFYTGPGFTDERITVYLATDCTPAPLAPDGPEEEAAEVVHVPIAELLGMIDAGAIEDAKSLIGILALLQRR